MAKLFTDSFSAPNTETKISDVTSEVPEWSQVVRSPCSICLKLFISLKNYPYLY